MIRKYTLLLLTALLCLAAGVVTSCLDDGYETIALERGNPQELILDRWTISTWKGKAPSRLDWKLGDIFIFRRDGTFRRRPDDGNTHTWQWKTNPYTGSTDGITIDGEDFGWSTWGPGYWQIFYPYNATGDYTDASWLVDLGSGDFTHLGGTGIGGGNNKDDKDNGDDGNGGNTGGDGNNTDDDGHEYVDLGLPSGTLWATCNIDADSPEQTGTFFAWGEIKGKTTYNWEKYKYANGSKSSLTKYNSTDKKSTLDTSDDAAYVNWGRNWCTPTSAQVNELINNTTVSVATKNGVKGRLFKSKKNSRSIFVPATGYRFESSLEKEGTFGTFWTSDALSIQGRAYALYYDPNELSCSHYERCYGRPVRPVRR